MDDQEPRTGRQPMRSIKSLCLDLDAARAGRTWLMLPTGFRDQSSGLTYPLPTARSELQELAAIDIPLRKEDSGCRYLRRALKEWKGRQLKRHSAVLDTGRREAQVKKSHQNYLHRMKELRVQANKAVDEVRKEAERAVANLRDLFALGREGLDGQMKAHLEGVEWKEEKISAAAFRECFRMVTMAVKGLGLPSEQRDKAKEAVLEEVAASLRDTQETVALGPGTDPEETEH